MGFESHGDALRKELQRERALKGALFEDEAIVAYIGQYGLDETYRDMLRLLASVLRELASRGVRSAADIKPEHQKAVTLRTRLTSRRDEMRRAMTEFYGSEDTWLAIDKEFSSKKTTR